MAKRKGGPVERGPKKPTAVAPSEPKKAKAAGKKGRR